MTNVDHDRIRSAVRSRYAEVAKGADGSTVGCCGTQSSCCGPQPSFAGQAVGYAPEQLAQLPEGADLGLGCGNPHALVNLRAGQTVVDLGSGGGVDCFLAARQVGAEGRVIGVDMTPEMVTRARANAARAQLDNVEFRLGEIEHLPVADRSVDVILSNCVINLSPDKQRVFDEAFRVLRPSGRLAIADVVALRELPHELRNDLEAHTGCIAGAVEVTQLQDMLRQAGFVDIRVDIQQQSREFIKQWLPGSGMENWVASASIEATRPKLDELC